MVKNQEDRRTQPIQAPEGLENPGRGDSEVWHRISKLSITSSFTIPC